MKKIVIDQKNAGLRIDRFLAREFFLYSRVDITKRIKNGEVLVNNGKIKPSYNLEEADEILLENFSNEPQDKSLKPNFSIELNVIFENADIVVINKQAGLQVHPSFNEKANTLANALLAKYPEIVDVHDDSVGAEYRPGIVHRLDKYTSGVMVIARNMKAFIALKENFKNRHIQKQYIAIARGIFNEKEGIIDKSIAKSSSYKKQVIARPNTKTTIKSAETHFRIIREATNYSLVELIPKTGRTHQIRIHLASIGHPIVGDCVYGHDEASETLKKLDSRHLLHAKKLCFILFDKKYTFSAPMPKDFKIFLKSL